MKPTPPCETGRKHLNWSMKLTPSPSLFSPGLHPWTRFAIVTFDNAKKMNDFDLTPKPLFSKIWGIITWRWRMQLALNAPFGLLWVADKTNPAVHQFNMSMLTAMHAEWMAPMMGIG